MQHQTRTFAPTRWSLVLTAGKASDPADRRVALSSLLETYWYPLYAFIRAKGYDSPAAEDLTQEFCARLVEGPALLAADPQRGRFRSFLLASLRNFLLNEHDRQQAIKRGGGRKVISLDLESAEQRYHSEPAHMNTAERLFERRWALELLDRVLLQLRELYDQQGKLVLFEALKPTLLSGVDAESTNAELGEKLGMSPDAVKTAAHRMRRRYRDLLRQLINDTVADPSEVDDEIRCLMSALKV